jgi:hypothetical protein
MGQSCTKQFREQFGSYDVSYEGVFKKRGVCHVMWVWINGERICIYLHETMVHLMLGLVKTRYASLFLQAKKNGSAVRTGGGVGTGTFPAT